MNIKLLTLAIVLFISQAFAQSEKETINFPSKDGLEITADFYPTNEKQPYMLLCHQAGYSRAEYQETASMFNAFGYNCLAIDQRSGNAVYKIENETAKRATEQGLRRTYIDAYQDMEAALIYLYEKGNKQPVALIGSSYSAALVFKLAVDHPEKISKILAFSPGEYIKGEDVKGWVTKTNVPVFMTSSKSEIPQLELLYNAEEPKNITHFRPTEEGIHGTRALWKATPNNSEYWVAVRKFIGKK